MRPLVGAPPLHASALGAISPPTSKPPESTEGTERLGSRATLSQHCPWCCLSGRVISIVCANTSMLNPSPTVCDQSRVIALLLRAAPHRPLLEIQYARDTQLGSTFIF